MNQEKSSVTVDTDNIDVVQYARRKKIEASGIKITFNQFPMDIGSQRSEAHKFATLWASRDDVISGDKAVIYFNGSPYLIEKYDDMDFGYQIEEKLTYKKVKKLRR